MAVISAWIQQQSTKLHPQLLMSNVQQQRFPEVKVNSRKFFISVN
jgi:hypothetical protein